MDCPVTIGKENVFLRNGSKGLAGLLCSVFLFSFHDVESAVSLESLTQSERLFLSASAVQIRPAEAEVAFSRLPGSYRLLVESGTQLDKDELWAVYEPEELELERALLGADEKSLPEELAKLTLAKEDEVAQLDESIKLLQSEYESLALSLQDPSVLEEPDLVERVQIALQGIEEKVGRARKRLALAVEGGSHQASIEKLELNHQKQISSFNELVKESELRAQFRGVLQLLEPLEEGVGEGVPRDIYVDQAEAIALLKNEERYQIEIEPMILDFNGVKLSSLFLEIDSERGESAIRADFLKTVVNAKDPSKVESWRFEVLEEDVQDVESRGSGGRAFASVFLDLKEPAYIVAKAKLLGNLPEEDGNYRGDWKRLVKAVVPECEFVAEGRGALAVRKVEAPKE